MKILPTVLKWTLAVLLGFSLDTTIYAFFLGPLSGRGVLTWLLWGVLGLVLSLASLRCIERFILPRLKSYSRAAQAAWIVVCLLAGLFMMLVIPLPAQKISFFYPRHRLELIPVEGRNPASQGNDVELAFLDDGLDYDIPLEEFTYGSAWSVNIGSLISSPSNPASPLTWEGSMLSRARLGLYSTPSSGIVRVVWDGQEQQVDLYNTAPNQVVIKLPVGSPGSRYLRLLAPGVYAVALGLFFLIAGLGLTAAHLQTVASTPPLSRWGWLRYSLPIIAGWSIYLLTFFPGIISSDATDQWSQFTRWQIVDWAPAFHTLTLWLLTRLWLSPAVVGVAQILSLSLVVAWGLGKLVGLGLPGGVAWLTAVLFAISPVNGSMAVTLWKDIPYAISLFGLNLIFFWIVISRGAWLMKPGRWLVLGVVGALVSLYRQNGLAIVGAALVVLLILYWRLNRPIILAAVVFAALFGVIHGPVYDLAGVKRMGNMLRDQIFLHHIGAHIKYQTPLTEEEKVYFNSLQPLADWQYNCCKVDPLFYPKGFNQAVFAANSAKNVQFAIDLALRDPKTELRHFVCVSSIIWQVCEQCFTLYHWIVPNDGGVTWVDVNNSGLKEDSRLPGLVKPLANWVWFSTSKPAVFWLWGPAFYLYLCIFCVSVFAVRCRSWRYLLLGLVPLVQSLVMILINLASDFRYQYSVYLIGLFYITLLFLPAPKEGGV